MSPISLVNIALELWGAGFCLLCIALCLLLVHMDDRLRLYILVGLGLEFVVAGCDALAGSANGCDGHLAWATTHVCYTLSFVTSFLLQATLTSYLCVRIEGAGGPSLRRWNVAVWGLSAAMTALTLLGTVFFIDAANVYHRGVGYLAVPVYSTVVNGADALLAVRSRRELGSRALGCVLFYSLAPLVAVAAQACLFGIDFVVVAAVFGFITIFLEMQAHTAETLQRRTEALARAEAEAAESRIRVMVSQIQPHFLFNTLDAIYVLIGTDPSRAKRALAAFSRYLRRNLESLSRTAPVPIEAELEHVRTYLELERMADEDKISFEIDVGALGFSVPALSVQTLVENAVKHGIAACEQGGRVTVRTRELPGEYTVSVIDDGVGFDPSQVKDEAAHVGLANTRERLASLCDGTLDVASRPGEGTTVIMHIPKPAGGGLFR